MVQILHILLHSVVIALTVATPHRLKNQGVKMATRFPNTSLVKMLKLYSNTQNSHLGREQIICNKTITALSLTMIYVLRLRAMKSGRSIIFLRRIQMSIKFIKENFNMNNPTDKQI